MRTLSATLEAAQKKADRLPYVEAKVYDFEQGVKRLSWTRLYDGGEPDNHHGIAFDGQGSMHRIRSGGSSTLLRQKLSSPFNPPSSFPLSFPLSFPISLVDWFDTWEVIATDCDGPCAIAAQGAKVYIFYKTTGNVLWKYYSHDYGESWSNAQLVSYADVFSLAAAWRGTGNVVVCFALRSNEISGIVLDTSDQSTSQHVKTFYLPEDVHHLLFTIGIGATYDASWPCCQVIFAAKESDEPYNHYDLFRTQFSNQNNWLEIESFLMAPEGEDITYEYPDCHLPASPASYENTCILAVEKFAGTTAYQLPITSHLVKGEYFSSATFTEPKPHPVIASGATQSQYGLRIATDASYWWMERPDGVWRAPRAAADPLDLTKDIISLTQSCHCEERERRGNLIIELDNHKGKYNVGEGLVPSLINKRSEIVLKLGYKTPAGNESSEAGTYWVDGWQYSSTPQAQSTFSLLCLDGWGLADRWTARYQMRWNKDEVGPKTVWQILHRILSRFGIRLTNTPPKSQSTAINNFYPDFTLNSGTQGTQALNKLLSFVPDKLVFRGQEAFTKDTLASESSCYSYDVIASGAWQSHPILSGSYASLVHASRARAIGRDGLGDRIVQDAHDWDLLKLAIDILRQDYDPNLEDVTRTQERADAMLRTQQTQQTQATLIVPTNVGQELLDVVTVTDERCGISEEKYRVEAIQTDYDRRQGTYQQQLTLGVP
jgi:hypothetical protein